jgi:hypothetical protein
VNDLPAFDAPQTTFTASTKQRSLVALIVPVKASLRKMKRFRSTSAPLGRAAAIGAERLGPVPELLAHEGLEPGLGAGADFLA